MRYNVAQLLKGPTGACRKYDLFEEIRNLDQELKPVGPLAGPIVLMRTSQGILATGTLSTVIEGNCKRCLEPARAEVEFELEEEFHPTNPIADAPIDKIPDEQQDSALLIDEHQILDLREVVRQALWLAAPMEMLCRPDCAGLCPTCGGNRNLGECQCEDSPVDPRWSALGQLLKDDKEPNEGSI
ncbi:MAG TPA: DUF177 domain-containing protein [Anaerolineae bacterium]|nr:DUF177 domain-containing protein [Anaerolineae bacterium]